MLDDLTPTQVQFISRFIRPISDRYDARLKGIHLPGHKKKAKTERDEDLDKLSGALQVWEKRQAEVETVQKKLRADFDFARLPVRDKDLVKMEADAASVRRSITLGNDLAAFTKAEEELKRLRIAANTLRNLVANEIAQLDDDDDDADDDALPDPALLVRSTAFDLLLAEVVQVRAVKRHPALKPAQATTKLTADVLETQRLRLMAEHNALCDAADTEIRRCQAAAARPGADAVAFESDARDAVAALVKASRDKLDELVSIIAEQGASKLRALADGGDEIALLEADRVDRIEAERSKLQAAIEAATKKIEGLDAKRTAAPKDAEKLKIGKEIRAERAKVDALVLRLAQLGVYLLDVDKRLAAMDKADGLVDGIDGAVAGISTINPAPAEDKDTASTVTNSIASFRKMVAQAANRVVVDRKLFPDERDVTQISADHAKELEKFALAAEGFVKDHQLDSATEALQLGQTTLLGLSGTRIFALPEVKLDTYDARAAALRTCESAVAALDALWALGADVDGLRTEGARLLAALRTKEGASTDLLVKEVAALEVAIKAAKARPLPDDKAAERAATAGLRKDAGAAGRKIGETLLKLHNTKKITALEAAQIRTDDLIVIENDKGVTQYHMIERRTGETVQRRDDKKVPREAIDALRLKMQMLDVLAQSQGEGMDDEITRLTAEAEALRAGIADGGKSYEKIEKLLSSFAKLVADKKLSKWHVTGLEELKVEKDRFAKSYAGKMLPAEALTAAEDLKRRAEAMEAKTAAIEAAYDAQILVLERIEKQLSPKTKGDEGGIGVMMAEIIKAGEVPGSMLTYLGIDDFKAIETLKTEIAAQIAILATLKVQDSGVKDASATELERCRSLLDTKSESKIDLAELALAALDAKLANDMADLTGSKTTSEKLTKLRDMLTAAATTATAAEQAKTDAAATQGRVEKQLKTVKKILSQSQKQGSTGTYQEYKAVLDGMSAQFKTSEKSWDKGKGDNVTALREFARLEADLTEYQRQMAARTRVLQPPNKIGRAHV